MLPYQNVGFPDIKTYVDFSREFPSDIKEPDLQLVKEIQKGFGIDGNFEGYKGLTGSFRGNGSVTIHFQRENSLNLGTLRKSAEDLARPIVSLGPTILYVDGKEHFKITTEQHATARDLLIVGKTPIGSPYNPLEIEREVDKFLRKHDVRLVRPTDELDKKHTLVHMMLTQTLKVTTGTNSGFKLGLEVGFSQSDLLAFSGSERERMPFEEAIRVHHKALGQNPDIALTVKAFNNARTTIPRASKHKTIEELISIRRDDGRTQWPDEVISRYTKALQRAVRYYKEEYLQQQN